MGKTQDLQYEYLSALSTPELEQIIDEDSLDSGYDSMEQVKAALAILRRRGYFDEFDLQAAAKHSNFSQQSPSNILFSFFRGGIHRKYRISAYQQDRLKNQFRIIILITLAFLLLIALFFLAKIASHV